MTESVITRTIGRAGQSLADGQVTTGGGAIYTCPASMYARIKFMSFFNTNVTSQTVNVFITRSGGTQRQLRRITLAQFADDEFFDSADELSLSPGDTIDADTTTTTAVDYFISGFTEELGN